MTADDIHQLKGPIAIFGASGFIGSRIFFRLSRYRNDVVGLSRNISRSWRFQDKRWPQIADIDITNPVEVIKAVERWQPKTVFNLSSYGGHSHQTEVGTINIVNFLGASNVFEAMKSFGFEAIVQAGSSSEYGLNSAAPTENDELIPNSDYAVSKVAVSYLVKYYGKVLGLPVMHLRLYSIYGPGQERRTLMPNLVLNCLQNKWPPLVEPDVSHDFVYVDDCADAFIKAALCLYNSRGYGESVNIATGIKTTIRELAETARSVFGVTTEPVFGIMPNRKWDLTEWYGDPTLAKELIGWNHKVPLKDGLGRMAEWEKEYNKI